MLEARFHDGTTAKSHAVHLRVDIENHRLVITGDTLAAETFWPLGAVRLAKNNKKTDTKHVLYLAFEDEKEDHRIDMRLVLDSDALVSLREHLPNLEVRKPPRSLIRKAVLRRGLALAAIAVILLVLLPSLAGILTNLLPIKREVALGETVLQQFQLIAGQEEDESFFCDDPKGIAVLHKMSDRIVQDLETEYDLKIYVIRQEMVNAFALPGGIILFTDALIQEAKTPEQVAGVLGHELGHILHRDPLRAAIYTTSTAGILSLLIGDFSGGALVYVLAQQTLNSSYTREAEQRADAFSVDRLSQNKIDLAGFAHFFEVLEQREAALPEALSYFSTHALSKDRRERIERVARQQIGTKRIITQEEWQALKSVCK